MRHNEEEIQRGIKLFKKYTDNVTCKRNKNGQNVWRGYTCEGGGARLRHSINEDAMTPLRVAHTLKLNHILRLIDAETQRILNRFI